MRIEDSINNMIAVRSFVLHAVEGLSDEQLRVIPNGFRNNILWNLGHIVVIQCALLYLPCRRPLPVPEWFHSCFYDGTSPADWSEPPDSEAVLGTLRTLNETLLADLKEGVFQSYERFELMPGFSLADVEHGITFHAIHEGIHLGIIMSLRKQC